LAILDEDKRNKKAKHKYRPINFKKKEGIMKTDENRLKNKKSFFVIREKLISSFLIISIMLLGSVNILYYDFLSLSPNQKVIAGQMPKIPQNTKGDILPSIVASVLDEEAFAVSNQDNQSELSTENYKIEFSLGGIVPIKIVDVEVVEPVYLVPGGHSIGILLDTEGVTVVGHSPIIQKDGTAIYPARDAGIEIGDFVTEINDLKINTNEEILKIINDLGAKDEELNIEYIRSGKQKETAVMPLYCSDSQSYRIGLYVRDNTAGVGTLTFFEPEKNIFGALGHQITEINYGNNENNENNNSKGRIVRADIQGIKIGQKGAPGEKMGVFVSGQWEGNIIENTTVGIFGNLDEDLYNPFFKQTLPAALASQVQVGPAEIYTVLEGEKIEKFSIKIVKILPNYHSNGKGMIIEVTDPKLIAKTGGIIQGMSGSPIIQNGYLIGAVTHVFINDPTRGYACFAEWMLEEAGLL